MIYINKEIQIKNDWIHNKIDFDIIIAEIKEFNEKYCKNK